MSIPILRSNAAESFGFLDESWVLTLREARGHVEPGKDGERDIPQLFVAEAPGTHH